MTISIQLPEKQSLKPSITVFGVGGGGGNAVNNMIATELEGVSFVVANTDAQALEESLCKNHIQLGESITQGLGAGSYPEVGKASAEEAVDEILDFLQGSNMVFITAGLGGGTGTGAAPVVARLAKERGILTVAVVTKPFNFEGTHRMRVAELGLEELQKYVDTLIVIPNQNLFRVADKNTTFLDAFKLADDVLHAGVRGVTDLMTMPGLINLDFSDVRSVMSEMGKAMMGTGEANGEGRAIQAAEAAIANPLLDNVSMQGARGVLINITGGYDMTLFEVDEAANRIKEEVDPEANIIFGSTFDKDAEGTIRVSVVATGIDLMFDSVPQKTSVNTANYTVVDNNKVSEEEGTRNIPLFPQKNAVEMQNDVSEAVQELPLGERGFQKNNVETSEMKADEPELDKQVAKDDEKNETIQTMTLSDVLERNAAREQTEQKGAVPKENTFSLPEAEDPGALTDKDEDASATKPAFITPVNDESKKDREDALTLPEGIFDSKQRSSSGSIFGGLFGNTAKKKDEASEAENIQTSTKHEDMSKEKSDESVRKNNEEEDLDIPAFLRRKN